MKTKIKNMIHSSLSPIPLSLSLSNMHLLIFFLLLFLVLSVADATSSGLTEYIITSSCNANVATSIGTLLGISYPPTFEPFVFDGLCHSSALGYGKGTCESAEYVTFTLYSSSDSSCSSSPTVATQIGTLSTCFYGGNIYVAGLGTIPESFTVSCTPIETTPPPMYIQLFTGTIATTGAPCTLPNPPNNYVIGGGTGCEAYSSVVSGSPAYYTLACSGTYLDFNLYSSSSNCPADPFETLTGQQAYEFVYNETTATAPETCIGAGPEVPLTIGGTQNCMSADELYPDSGAYYTLTCYSGYGLMSIYDSVSSCPGSPSVVFFGQSGTCTTFYNPFVTTQTYNSAMFNCSAPAPGGTGAPSSFAVQTVYKLPVLCTILLITIVILVTGLLY